MIRAWICIQIVKFEKLICQCRHCRRQCKIFASGVNFSIFTHYLCFFLLKLLKLGEIGSVKYLAWKSGGVNFLTNIMSVLIPHQLRCNTDQWLWAQVMDSKPRKKAENPVIFNFGYFDFLHGFFLPTYVQCPFLAAPVEIDWQVAVDLPHHHRQPWSWTCAVSIRSISPLSPQPAKTSDGRAGEGRLARGTEVLEVYSHWATFAEVKYQPMQTAKQDLFVSLLLPSIHTQMHSRTKGGGGARY